MNLFRNNFFMLIFSYMSLLKQTESSCPKYLRELAQSQSDFVQCTVNNAKPAESCTNCFQKHDQMVKNYEVLTRNCSSDYIGQNRLNIVYNMQKNIVELWNKGFCNDCFENGGPSNSTKEFALRKKLFNDCLINWHKQECSKCKLFYIDLNTFYRKMDEDKKGKICFDLQDEMNETRSTWSKDLKCCHRELNFTLFSVGSSMFVGVTILFYLGMYGYTKRLERNHEVLDSTVNSGNEAAQIASTSSVLSSENMLSAEVTTTRINGVENIIDSLEESSLLSQPTENNLLNF